MTSAIGGQEPPSFGVQAGTGVPDLSDGSALAALDVGHHEAVRRGHGNANVVRPWDQGHRGREHLKTATPGGTVESNATRPWDQGHSGRGHLKEATPRGSAESHVMRPWDQGHTGRALLKVVTPECTVESSNTTRVHVVVKLTKQAPVAGMPLCEAGAHPSI